MASREHLDLLCHARPLRLGLLVPEIDGVPWQSTWAGALGAVGQLWGGSGAVLVPFGPNLADEVVWRLTDVGDPDWWTAYAPSYSDPVDLPAERATYWQQQLEDAGSRMDEQSLAQFEADEGIDAAVQVQPPLTLLEMLSRRGGALDDPAAMLSRGLLTTGRVPYPMVDVTAFVSLPQISERKESDRPSVRLLQAAHTGRLTPRLRQHLVDGGTPPVRRETLTELSDVYGDQSFDALGPFALSEVGCNWFGRGTVDRTHMTLVVGDRPEDFALAYLTRRTRSLAWWLPSDLDAAETSDVVSGLARKARGSGYDIVVTSISDQAAVGQMVGALQRVQHDLQVSASDWHEVLARRPNRLLCSDVTPVAESVPVREGLTVPLPSPLPPVLTVPDIDMRWMVQTSAEDWVVHRDRRAANAIFQPDVNQARTSDGGIAFDSPRFMISRGAPLRLQVPRPRLRPLEILDQLSAVCADAGWTLMLSDKGAYATATVELLGGAENVEAAVTNEHTAAVLAGYLDISPDAPGYLLRDKRRYLSVADAEVLAANDGVARLAGLADDGVLTRGVLLKCGRCRHLGFYRPSDIDPQFACVRCSQLDRPTQASWVGGVQPTWYYRLDEAVRQFLEHRGELPLLAFISRFRRSQDSVQVEVEVELHDHNGKRSEIDFVALEGGRLWLGEAFTGDRYVAGAASERQRLGRLRAIAEMLNAHGVQLHTAADAMDSRTDTAARDAFTGSGILMEIHGRARALARR